MSEALVKAKMDFAKKHGMTLDFVNWFMTEKKTDLGEHWFMSCCIMWEGWKACKTHGGWIEWKGGSCPVDADCSVDIMIRTGEERFGKAGAMGWEHMSHFDDIILYRPFNP